VSELAVGPTPAPAPSTICPSLAAYVRQLGGPLIDPRFADLEGFGPLGADEAKNKKLLMAKLQALGPKVLSTVGSVALQNQRRWKAVDWLCRGYPALWLRAAGLPIAASALELGRPLRGTGDLDALLAAMQTPLRKSRKHLESLLVAANRISEEERQAATGVVAVLALLPAMGAAALHAELGEGEKAAVKAVEHGSQGLLVLAGSSMAVMAVINEPMAKRKTKADVEKIARKRLEGVLKTLYPAAFGLLEQLAAMKDGL